MLAVVGVVAGLFVILLGVTGLASSGHSGFSRFMHRVHHRLTRLIPSVSRRVQAAGRELLRGARGEHMIAGHVHHPA